MSYVCEVNPKAKFDKPSKGKKKYETVKKKSREKSLTVTTGKISGKKEIQKVEYSTGSFSPCAAKNDCAKKGGETFEGKPIRKKAQGFPLGKKAKKSSKSDAKKSAKKSEANKSAKSEAKKSSKSDAKKSSKSDAKKSSKSEAKKSEALLKAKEESSSKNTGTLKIGSKVPTYRVGNSGKYCEAVSVEMERRKSGRVNKKSKQEIVKVDPKIVEVESEIVVDPYNVENVLLTIREKSDNPVVKKYIDDWFKDEEKFLKERSSEVIRQNQVIMAMERKLREGMFPVLGPKLEEIIIDVVVKKNRGSWIDKPLPGKIKVKKIPKEKPLKAIPLKKAEKSEVLVVEGEVLREEDLDIFGSPPPEEIEKIWSLVPLTSVRVDKSKPDKIYSSSKMISVDKPPPAQQELDFSS
jgi:hypothetical protein